MLVTVRFFAVVRERLGVDYERVDLRERATVAELWLVLCEAHPILNRLRPYIRTSVNLEFADDALTLEEGDEVALIPPVAGGCDLPLLVDGPLDLSLVVQEVARDEAGATVTFVGVVRNHSKGKAVDHLVYEAYPEMASVKLRQVADEITAKWPDVRCALQHRYGRLEVGDAAVTIAVSSPHRAEAFAACEAAIDRIKEIVPIWKKEVGPDGASWVGMGS